MVHRTAVKQETETSEFPVNQSVFFFYKHEEIAGSFRTDGQYTEYLLPVPQILTPRNSSMIIRNISFSKQTVHGLGNRC